MTDWKQASLAAALFYRDPRAAIDWLEKAFGFRRAMIIRDGDGSLAHSQLRFGNGYLMVGPEWTADTVSPAAVDGRNTQTMHLQIDTDIDAHCERARAAGAIILEEPVDQFYGDRTYRARDLEGHLWTVAQNRTPFSIEEARRTTGFTIEMFEDAASPDPGDGVT